MTTRGATALTALLTACLSLTAQSGLADHESTNRLEFAPVSGSPRSSATGEGTIEYHGGAEPESRWTVTFQFTGLAPNAAYAVVDQGRFGEDGSPEATEFTPLCEFRADDAGAGGCWDYLLGLRRANVLQLRAGDADGDVVLLATRDPDEPGVITSVANRFSPLPTATPGTLPAASPVSQLP